MKDLVWTFILGIILGIVLQIWLINPYYPGTNKIEHDTITVTNDSIIKNDSIVTVFPKETIISLDSISIDTIKTVVNGKVVDAKYKITKK